ncbi:MAG: hypothetical protein ACI4T9_03215, partial [Prevotella sp.]
MDNRNSTDKKLNFGDIHELLRQVNEAPAPSWQASVEEPKPKKMKRKKRVTPHAEPIPEISWGGKDQAEPKEPKFGIKEENKEANDFPSQDSVAKNASKAKTVPKAANGKASPKPKSVAREPVASDEPNPSDSLSALWHAASASKAGKFAESQVWIDKGLYRQIEAFNLRCGKPVPTKHVVNAILRMF